MNHDRDFLSSSSRDALGAGCEAPRILIFVSLYSQSIMINDSDHESEIWNLNQTCSSASYVH
jgi:hypothetical protein